MDGLLLQTAARPRGFAPPCRPRREPVCQARSLNLLILKKNSDLYPIWGMRGQVFHSLLPALDTLQAGDFIT
jgi:hypothetical protein